MERLKPPTEPRSDELDLEELGSIVLRVNGQPASAPFSPGAMTATVSAAATTPPPVEVAKAPAVAPPAAAPAAATAATTSGPTSPTTTTQPLSGIAPAKRPDTLSRMKSQRTCRPAPPQRRGQGKLGNLTRALPHAFFSLIRLRVCVLDGGDRRQQSATDHASGHPGPVRLGDG